MRELERRVKKIEEKLPDEGVKIVITCVLVDRNKAGELVKIEEIDRHTVTFQSEND